MATKTSNNLVGNWYDYENQAWTCGGVYQRCCHPGRCHSCFGTKHAGETAIVTSVEACGQPHFAVGETAGHNVASGDYSTAASSGYSSKAASSGDASTAASSGDASKAASSGNSSTAASSGNASKAASSGNFSKAASSGKDTIAMVAGLNGSAKAGENGLFVLCWFDDTSKRNRTITGYVGEGGIKADTWYCCDENGNLVEKI